MYYIHKLICRKQKTFIFQEGFELIFFLSSYSEFLLDKNIIFFLI